MPSRFLTELGYDPYGNSDGVGSAGFRDDDFGESDFDPFPDDLPVFE